MFIETEDSDVLINDRYIVSVYIEPEVTHGSAKYRVMAETVSGEQHQISPLLTKYSVAKEYLGVFNPVRRTIK